MPCVLEIPTNMNTRSTKNLHGWMVRKELPHISRVYKSCQCTPSAPVRLQNNKCDLHKCVIGNHAVSDLHRASDNPSDTCPSASPKTPCYCHRVPWASLKSQRSPPWTPSSCNQRNQGIKLSNQTTSCLQIRVVDRILCNDVLKKKQKQQQ